MIYFLAHWDWILERSRADIVESMKNDYETISICPLEENEKNIKEIYYDSINWDLDRTKTLDFVGLRNLRKILIKLEKGSIIHIFTLKTLFLYLISSIFLTKDLKIVASVTGLGYLFAGTKLGSLLKFLIRPFIIFKINKAVDFLIFQNKENLNEFLSYSKFIGKVKIIEGSGLKTEKIIKKENFNKVPNIIFVGRLLYEKGIREFLELVKLIKNNHKANFFVAGKPDFGNKSSINKNEFDALCNNDNVTYLGEINVYSELYKYDILIQPSYHEGFSRVLLEGIYTGLWCMSNDLPGTRKIIDETSCGKLITNNNLNEYLDGVDNYFEDFDKQNLQKARIIIEKNYSTTSILNQMKDVYNELR